MLQPISGRLSEIEFYGFRRISDLMRRTKRKVEWFYVVSRAWCALQHLATDT